MPLWLWQIGKRVPRCRHGRAAAATTTSREQAPTLTQTKTGV